MRICNEVRAMRARQGISQAELAGALGVSRQTVNSIETGRYQPSLLLALQLAHHFQSTVEEIFRVERC